MIANRLGAFLTRGLPLRLNTGRDREHYISSRLQELVELYELCPRRVHANGATGERAIVQEIAFPRKRQLLAEILEARLPREEFVRELAVLGFDGEAYSMSQYREALESHLKTPIVEYSMQDRGDERETVGMVTYDAELNRIQIGLPLRLSWWLRQYTLAHELGHVAANHLFPIYGQDGHITEYRRPPRGIARYTGWSSRLPEEALRDLQEEEAEQRARHALLTGELGGQTLHLGRIKQLS